jgi:hypothetical protein
LVDGDNVALLQDGKTLGTDGSKVSSNNEWCLSKGPESKVSFFFFHGEDLVSNLEHIWIVPVTWTSRFSSHVVNQEVRFDLLPLVLISVIDRNILSGSP